MRRYWLYILAFIIPIAMIIVSCCVRNVWLFGEESILRGDAGVQYVYVFEELWNKVHSGDLSFYSWNALGGYDMYLNMLYYAVSPATLIMMLLPKECLYDAIQFFMVVKWALMCVSAVYFFAHTRLNRMKEQKKVVALVFGLCYAMSNYFLNVIQFFNWWDSFIIFPLLLILVEKMVNNGKWRLYCLLLTISMLCNFYISFSCCIFLLFWFVLQMLVQQDTKKRYWFTFMGSSVLSALSAAAVILPCVLNVGVRNATDVGSTVREYVTSCLFTVEDFVSKLFIFTPISVNGMPYTTFYMSIGVVVMSLLYVFIRMDKKEKYYKMGMGIFVLVSFFVGALDYAWHGFSIPNVTDHRYAYLFVMLMLLIVLDVLSNLEQIKLWQFVSTFIVSVALFVYTFIKITDYENVVVYLVTILLIVFYLLLLVLFWKKSISKKAFVYTFLCVCFLEIVSNGYYQLGYFKQVPPEKEECVQQACELSKQLTLNSGERIAAVDSGHNPGLRMSLSAMSGFLSYAYGNFAQLNVNLGLHGYQNAGFLYNGSTPVLNLLFNIKYGMSMNESCFADCEKIAEKDDLSLYEMKRTAGLGYMVKDSIENWQGAGKSTFQLQNSFIQCATGDGDCEVFTPVYPSDISCSTSTGNQVDALDLQDEQYYQDAYVYNYTPLLDNDGIMIQFTADKDQDLYVSLTENVKNYVRVLVDDEIIYYAKVKVNQNLIHIGDVEKGQSITVVCAVEGMVNTEMQVIARFAEFNDAVYQEKYEQLSSDVYEIDKMSGDNISGTIDVSEDGVMMTSVQAMDGFDVYVDNEKTDYKIIGDALIGVPLSAGTHTVQFVYHTPYARVGWIISLISIIIYFGTCLKPRIGTNIQ
jgi:uncharacterized membrane protein YfhO